MVAVLQNARRRLDSVTRAGGHLLELINDVLDLTRIENDDFSLRSACVDAWEAIAECVSPLNASLRSSSTSNLRPIAAWSSE